MEVIFHNYLDNQSVFWPIAIVKGSIQQVQAQNRDKHADTWERDSSSNAMTLIIKCRHLDSDDKLVAEVPIKCVGSEFVVVIKMKSGRNTLLIFEDSSCQSQQCLRKLVLNYVEEDVCHPFTVQGLIVHCLDSCLDIQLVEILQQKVQLGLELGQAIFSELLLEESESERKSRSRQSFHLHRNLSGSHSVELVQLKLTKCQLKESYTSETLWTLLARQVRSSPSLWSSKKKFVAFVLDPWKSISDHSQKTLLKDDMGHEFFPLHHMEGLGGGGLAMLRTDILGSWPDKSSDVLDCMWHDKEGFSFEIEGGDSANLKRSIGEHFSKSLGALIHEMGHIFDLGHTENAVMGNEYHLAHILFAPSNNNNDNRTRQRSMTMTTVDGEIPKGMFRFTKSCSRLLLYHRWFQTGNSQAIEERRTDRLEFIQRKTIISSSPLVVIELRDISNGLVIKYWCFEQNPSSSVNKFCIGRRLIPEAYQAARVQLVAINKHGNMLKEILDCSKLPEAFTFIQRRQI